MRTAVYLFALGMAAMFAVFLATVPVRTLTPQIARLRYYACQNGVGGGALSSSLREFDWRKAFVWRASDTEYRQRQLSQFFEVLTPRLYAYLYYWFGPFMWLPLCLFNAFLIGFMIALIVRQWTGSWLPGIVAGSFWLMTPEVLVGHHAPIRYAKDFATLEMLGMISLLLALRRSGRVRLWIAGGAICLIWWLGLFTDEYILFTLPAFAVALLSWPWLRKCRWQLLVTVALLTMISFWLFIFVLPDFISPDIRPAFAELKLKKMSGLRAIIERNFNYLIANTVDNFAHTFGFGWSFMRSLPQLTIAAAATLFLLVTGFLTRAGRGTGKMVLFWLITVISVAGVLLPEGRDILHQITYYNRPLIALLMVVFGLMTENVLTAGFKGAAVAWLSGLVIIAVLNFYLVATGVTNDPEEAYLTRYGLNNILQLHNRLRSGELTPPVYLSYPRFRNVQSGVYDELESTPPWTAANGFPWSLYRALMPRLYLRHYEKGTIRANPRQFARWVGVNEHEYRATAKYFYDLPAGVAWNLESIRKSAVLPETTVKWIGAGGRVMESQLVTDLLGKAPFTRLKPGRWWAGIVLPADNNEYELIFALRHDGATSFLVEDASPPTEEECLYRWSWRLFTVRLRPADDETVLCLQSKGEIEIIGPLVVPAAAVASRPLSRREYILPAGIPYLDVRGFD